jgi:hypothetical protein
MINIYVPVSEDLIRLPLGNDGGVEANTQSSAIEQHVEGVRNKTQTVGPKAVN